MSKTSSNRITLQEVAKHAGVSRATASLVLRGSPLVAERTRKKVQASMQELGYVYDRIAASLRSNHSSTVGLIIMELANPFYSELLIGIHQELDKHDQTLILGTTFNSLVIQERLLSTMLEHRVAGIILSGVPNTKVEAIQRIQKQDVPIVLVGRKPPEIHCDYVGVDNITGGRIAIEHLLSKGHQKIAFLGGFSDLSSRQERLIGCNQAFEQAGLHFDPSLSIESPPTHQGGVQALEQLLKQSHQATAIFCYNDMIAIGVMQKMKDLGMTPGKELDIIGFDDIPEASIFSPKLTTVSSSIREMGVRAATLLYSRLSGLKADPQHIILPPQLIIRESCK